MRSICASAFLVQLWEDSGSADSRGCGGCSVILLTTCGGYSVILLITGGLIGTDAADPELAAFSESTSKGGAVPGCVELVSGGMGG